MPCLYTISWGDESSLGFVNTADYMKAVMHKFSAASSRTTIAKVAIFCKTTLPHKNSHIIKMPYPKLKILVSFYSEKKFQLIKKK